MNRTRNSPTARLLRVALPAGNPLCRGVDRVEGASLAVTVLVGLVLVPIMLVFGSLTYATLAARAERQAEEHVDMVATLTEDVPAESVTSPGEGVLARARVAAEWRTPDGVVHTGMVPVDEELPAGAKVPVWLDETGRVVDPPITSADARLAAATVAAVGWLVATGLLALAHLGLRRLLDRRRGRDWEREWARVEPEWCGRQH